MAAVYKSICSEVDSLLLMINKLVEEQVTLKVTMEELMNNAFVDVAKARYIMGSTCVTKMQLPTENSNPIKAQVTVSREEVGDHYEFKLHRNEEINSLTKIDSSTSSNIGIDNSLKAEINGEWVELSKSEKSFKKVLQDDPKSLKRSKNAFCVNDDLYDEYNDELLDELSTDSESSLASMNDPIRLFGILVPNSLKQAQVGFRRVVDVTVEVATVQSKLREVLHKYSHMKKVKNLIEAAASETKVNILVPRVYWTPSEVSSVSCISLKPSEDEEKSEEDKVSVQKSIRSVIFDKMQDEAEDNYSLWSNESQTLTED